MYEVFTKLLNMSLTASFLVIAVILLRILLKKAPKRNVCILWVLVAFRLIVPFSISSSASAFNILHKGSDASEQMEYFRYNGKTEKPVLIFNIPSGENADTHQNVKSSEMIVNSDSYEHELTERHTSKIYLPSIMMIWALGTAAILLYALLSFFSLRKNVAASVHQTENIYICDEINSPFILGIARPRIYLPSGLAANVKGHVIAHEQAHLKRFDHLWKPLGFLLLAVYWFNPVLWLAYVLFCRDIEAACDEKVIKDFDREWKVNYSEALLACAVQKKMITVCPLAFGETNVKGRVKGVLNYKKPAFWVTCVTVIICVIMAICFLTNPKNADNSSGNPIPSQIEAQAVFCKIQKVDGFTHAIKEEVIRFEELTYQIDESNDILSVSETGNITIPSGSSAFVHFMKEGKEVEVHSGDVATVMFTLIPVERLQISMQGQQLEFTDNDPICMLSMQHEGNAELIIRNLSSEMVTISSQEEQQVVTMDSPPGWRESILNDSFYEDRIYVEISRFDYFLRAGHNKMLGIWYGVNAYKSVGENPEYIEVQEPWVQVFGTTSGEYKGGLSAVVDDEGVIHFNLNGYVQVKCNGQTTEDGVLDLLSLQKAGFQVETHTWQSTPYQRRSVQVAEDITTETVTMNREMSEEEAEQLQRQAKDISLDDIKIDKFVRSTVNYDKEKLQVLLYDPENRKAILATVPDPDGKRVYEEWWKEGYPSEFYVNPLEYIQTYGSVKLKDFSSLIPDQKELDLYIGKTIGEFKKAGFMYSGYDDSGHTYRAKYGNNRYSFIVDFDGSDVVGDPEYVTDEGLQSKTITKIEFDYFGIEMTSKVIFT